MELLHLIGSVTKVIWYWSITVYRLSGLLLNSYWLVLCIFVIERIPLWYELSSWGCLDCHWGLTDWRLQACNRANQWGMADCFILQHLMENLFKEHDENNILMMQFLFIQQKKYRQQPYAFKHTSVTDSPDILHAKFSNKITNEVCSIVFLQSDVLIVSFFFFLRLIWNKIGELMCMFNFTSDYTRRKVRTSGITTPSQRNDQRSPRPRLTLIISVT